MTLVIFLIFAQNERRPPVRRPWRKTPPKRGQENSRLRRAVSDLTLDKLILQEAARGNF